MTDNDYTALGLVLDTSGSMYAIKDDAQGALDQFIQEQRELPGRATLTFVPFNTRPEVRHQLVPLAEVEPFVINPNGSTALLDAIGLCIQTLGSTLAAMPDDQRPGKVLVAIITDGQENNSHEFTREQIFDLIGRQRDEWQWDFVFLAANQDAIATGASFNIPSSSALTFAATGAGVRAGGQSMSRYTASYRTTGKGTFDPEDSK